MFHLKFSKAYANLIVLAVILTPIFGISEVFALISGSLASQSEALTSVYVKGLKDAILLGIIVLGVAQVFVRRRVVLNKPYLAFMTLVACSFLLSCFFKEAMILAAGVRWILPVCIFPFIYHAIDRKLQERIAKWMIVLFFIALGLQCAQLFLIKGWWGYNIFGLSKRNPGFYLIPSSMACFSALTGYYARYYCNRPALRRAIVFFLAPLSILLTASATGLIVQFLFWMHLLYGRVKQKTVVVMGVAVLLGAVLISLPLLTGREDIFSSISERGDVLSEVFSPRKMLASADFGDATNTGVLLAQRNASADSTSFVADSTASSIIYNSGLLSLFLFLGFLFSSKAGSSGRFAPSQVSFFMVICPFMVTTILFELFPANLLLMVNMAYFYSQRRRGMRLAPSPAC